MDKKLYIFSVAAALIANAQSAVLIDFTNQSGIYDVKTTVDVALNDPVHSVDFIMTVTAYQFDSAVVNLNSNAGGLGVADDSVDFDGGEIITISFNFDVDIDYIEFGGIGAADAIDAASLKFGSDPALLLYTDQPDFAGDTDIWNPDPLYRLMAGDTIVLKAAGATGASFDLENMGVAAVPEPSYSLLLGLGGLTLLSRHKRPATKE